MMVLEYHWGPRVVALRKEKGPKQCLTGKKKKES